jgi:hypothetical protein
MVMVGSDGVPLQQSADAMVGGRLQDGLASTYVVKRKYSHFLCFPFLWPIANGAKKIMAPTYLSTYLAIAYAGTSA